jgi:glycosyltransferase involved in cell wall biosynthesis
MFLMGRPYEKRIYMKISILHYSVPPIVGGVESVIGHHARLMCADGHEVNLIAARGKVFDEKITLTKIPLADSRHERVNQMKMQLDKGEATKDFESLRDDLANELQAALKNVDILIAHNVCSLNKNLALTAAIHQLHMDKKLPRLILWHHDLAWTTPRYQKELHEGYPWDLLKTAWADAIQVTISEARRDEIADLMNLNQSQIQVIPNGVDLENFFKLDSQTIEYIKKLDLLNASPLLLLPVRITSRKNIELALQITAELKRDFPKTKIVVTGPLGPHNVGNVNYFEKLKKLREELNLKDSAHLLAELTDEFIPDAVISDFYKLADALLFPSIEEGFGIPMLEAGFSNIPIFCSDIAPLKKLGGDFVNYFSLNESPTVIAKRMSEFFSNSKTFLMKASVRESFTWENIYQTQIEPLLHAAEGGG